MTVTACVLAALVAFETASSPAGDCALTDNRCKAKQYERRAAAASMPGPRALYLYNAHRSYLILFEKDGQVGDLCEARRTLEASLAVEGQPQDQRSMSQGKQEELTALARRHGARCKHAKKRAASDRPIPPAGAPPAEVAVAELLAVTPKSEPVAQASPTPEPAAAAPPAPAPAARVVAEPTRLVMEGPTPPPRRVEGRRSPARLGVGIGLVTVSTGLLAGMTAVLVARQGYDEKIAALNAQAAHETRPLTAAEMADSVAWDTRFVRMEKTGAVLGGLAAVSAVAAIMVLALPKRGQTSQARVRPVGAGVHINF